MRSLYETATKASAGAEAVLPGNRESLGCSSVRDGAFPTRIRASKRGRVLVMAALSFIVRVVAEFHQSGT